MRFSHNPGLLTIALLALACHDVTGPDPEAISRPLFSHTEGGPAFYASGSVGTGTATPGSSRQDFEFDIGPDLRTGTLSFRDWSFVRGDGSTVTVTVSASDPYTAIAWFRNGSAACSDPTRGAEFDGWGRLDNGNLMAFTVVACDNGPAGSGGDRFRLSIPSAGYQREGLVSSGDVVKSGTFPPPANPRITGQGWHPPGRPDPATSYGKEFDFEATSAPSGRLMWRDWENRAPDGTPLGFTANSQTDPATSVNSYHQLSSTCVRFGGTGRISSGTLAPFWVDVCDNASPGTGFDTFTLNVPTNFLVGGTLTAGDIVLGAPAPTTGDLSVAAATTGETPDLDPDGYTVTVDASTDRPLAINGSVTYTGLSAGDHPVAVSGLASNCTVNGANPRTMTVTAGGTVSTTFSVHCAPLRGDLTVTVATTGVSLDQDGYTVRVDGANPQPIAINGGRVTYASLPAGDHTVDIAGVAPNCSVGAEHPRTVAVPAGGAITTSFSVICEPGPATRIAFTGQPSNTRVNETISPAVQVTAYDAQGSRATGFNGSVTIAIGRNGGGLIPGTLSGTRTVTAVNGVATFSDLRIDRAGDYTLRVTSSGLTGAESWVFQIQNLVCLLGICL